MAKAPKPETSLEDVVALALFAQRSPNGEFRERAFSLALQALAKGAPSRKELAPLAEFAARSKANGASAEHARGVATRLLREAGHAELRAQLAGSMKAR